MYLLFSDGTWVRADSHDEIKELEEKHVWPFPLDIKGDPRRSVRIITEIGLEVTRKGI